MIRGTKVPVKLWPHQREAYGQMLRYVESYRAGEIKASALVHMPTGTGKTAVIACLARVAPRVNLALVLSPRKALREQIANDLARDAWPILGVDPALLDRPIQEIQGKWKAPERPGVGVMTIQRLVREQANDSGEYRWLLRFVDLLILDEGHAEPAPVWSQAIRGFDCPRVLFTATPFRNDLKAFDINFDRHTFGYSLEKAIADRVVRDVAIVPLAHPGSPSAFAKQLVAEYRKAFPSEPAAKDIGPRVIVRCESHETIRQIVHALHELKQPVVGIHERFAGTPPPERRHELRFVPKRKERELLNARFWVHQFKLLEGIDEPRFQMVAMYEELGSTRALIQQIGRVLRNPGMKRNARAVVLDHSGGKTTQRWQRYRAFDSLLRAQPELLREGVQAVTTKRILSGVPEVAYVLGDFRRKPDLDKLDPLIDLRFPCNARIHERVAGSTLADMAARISQQMLERDQLYWDKQFGAHTHVWWYIRLRPTPYLVEHFFLEPSFHVAVLHATASRVYLTDSGGAAHVGDVLGPPLRAATMRRLLRQAKGHRLTRVSLQSANLGERAIRSRSVGAYSLDVIAPAFDDHLFLCRTAEGRIRVEEEGEERSRRRYVGFGKGRVSDQTAHLTLKDLLAWFADLDATSMAARAPALGGLSRFAEETVAPVDPKPRHILLDAGDFEGDYVTNDAARAPLCLDDLCHDIAPDGTFRVVANGKAVAMTLSYVDGHYLLQSPELDQRFVALDPVLDRRSIIGRLNEERAFRVLPMTPGIAYASGSFFRPLVRLGKAFDDSRIKILSALEVEPRLVGVKEEKGNACPSDGSGWQSGSLFHLVQTGGARTSLSKYFRSADLIVCDDMGTESADFLVADTRAQSIAFLHAKASETKRPYSASALQEVIAQAQKNLRYAHPFEEARPPKSQSWHVGPWTAPRVKGQVKSRIVRGRGTGTEIWDRMREILRAPNGRREVWLLLGNILSKSAFENELRSPSPAAEAVQAVYLLEGLVSAAMLLGCSVRIFCMP